MAVGERQPFRPIVLKPNIEAERPCPAPGLLDQLDRAIRPGKIEVGDPDKGAAGRKRQAGSTPDATAGSCHKSRLIRTFRHITSSSSGVGYHHRPAQPTFPASGSQLEAQEFSVNHGRITERTSATDGKNNAD